MNFITDALTQFNETLKQFSRRQKVFIFVFTLTFVGVIYILSSLINSANYNCSEIIEQSDKAIRRMEIKNDGALKRMEIENQAVLARLAERNIALMEENKQLYNDIISIRTATARAHKNNFNTIKSNVFETTPLKTKNITVYQDTVFSYDYGLISEILEITNKYNK